jgi:hypothetical protein
MLLVRGLVVLGAILVVLSLIAAYVRFQALDSDSVEQLAGDLIADQQIRDEVADTLVDELFANVDVAAAFEQRLPPEQQGLAGPIASGVQLAADRLARELLERPRVQELWVASVRRAHENLINVLEGDTERIQTAGGAVVLDLRPLVVQLGDRVAILGNIGQRFADDPDAGRITILESDQLETAQDLTQLFKVLGLWLWIVPVILWAVAVWLAEGRRRDILRMIGISSIITGLLVLVTVRVAGSYVVDELATTESIEVAAGNAWDILTAQLRDGGITLVGLGALLLVAVWISGPSGRATETRQWLAPHIARAEIAFGGAALLLGLLVWWGPTVQTQRWQLILASAVVLALGIEVLRRQTAAEFPDSRRPS